MKLLIAHMVHKLWPSTNYPCILLWALLAPPSGSKVRDENSLLIELANVMIVCIQKLLFITWCALQVEIKRLRDGSGICSLEGVSDLDSKRLQVHLKRRGSQNLSANTNWFISLKPKLFIPDFVSLLFLSQLWRGEKLWDKIWNRKPGFGAYPDMSLLSTITTP